MLKPFKKRGNHEHKGCLRACADMKWLPFTIKGGLVLTLGLQPAT